MVQRLKDTKAIASRPVPETCNPDVSGFRPSDLKDGSLDEDQQQPCGGSCGAESLRSATWHMSNPRNRK